tara:strand:- start:449 stop:838 length:390 start_codon:yes stop_codon:yes gene_type:complete
MTKYLVLCASGLLMVACANKPAPTAFSPDSYDKVVRSEKIELGLPIHSPAAKYPSWQVAKRQDGWVLLEYTILTNGRTHNVHVIDSSPTKIFDQSAIDAVQQYRYRPIQQNGQVISVDQVRSKITFDAL